MSARLFCCIALSGLLLFTTNISAQTKVDKKVIKQLKSDIEYLASDALEGRLTGTEGERKAGDYIISRYEKMKIKPYKNQYRHSFQFVHGKAIGETLIEIGEYKGGNNKGVFPLAFSSNKNVSSSVLADVPEQGSIWLLPVYENKDEADDAHFDFEKSAFDRARKAAKEGATGVLFYDNFDSKYAPEFNGHSDYETVDIPVAFMSYKVWSEYAGSAKNSGLPITMNIALKKTERTGNNIATYIDNKAKYTIILGAHYDHLGFGEDGSSLYAGKERQIHNGADDNASGAAALMQLAQWAKKSKLKRYNYLFVHFSGEELGLFGSKAFAKEEGIDSLHIAYMLNMDMVGRLNDSTRALTLGGIGTSPMWGDVVTMSNKTFKVNLDSAGIGPSDHSSFYNKGIPVLFFFTGSHHDYHKPTDDADKINYTGEAEVINLIKNVVTKMDAAPKPSFTVTKQSTVGKVRFKVTLGIMPDYSYNDGGVRADGVSAGKPADKAGIIAGDIIIAIGKEKVDGMQSYMEALAKQKEGATTTVTIKRDGKEMKLPITFK